MSRKTCPTCGKPEAEAFKPFCSKRCADIDLGHWLKGRYVIPGREGELGEGRKPAEEQDRDKD
jgi:uncharacterized protein